MSPRLNVQDYSRIPRFDLRGGIALGTALVSATPEGASEGAREASAEIHQCLQTLNEAWDVRGTERRESLRPYDQRVDAAWSALYGALDATARLPGGRERSLNAGLLRDDLFPDGLTFLTYRYDKEWVESDKKLRKIREKELAAGITAAVGIPDYLEELEAAHRDYGQALSITSPAEAPLPDVNLREHMEELRAAIAEYALQLVAWGNQRGGAHYDAARLALAPIDAARRLETRSGGASAEEPPETLPAADPAEPQAGASLPQAGASQPQAGVAQLQAGAAQLQAGTVQSQVGVSQA